MSRPPKPRGLGRGLAALLGDEDIASTVTAASARTGPHGAIANLPITALRPGRYQPRTHFDDLDPLVESLRQFGLLQPILVRPVDGALGEYEIVAGERRWQAAQRVPLHEVPVVVRTLDDVDALQLALVENLQRANLSAVDEAQGYRRLIDEFSQTQETIAQTVGRSRPHIANTLRLLDLPAPVQAMVGARELSAGQARALLAFDDPLAMAKRAVAEGLTVRDLERLAAGEKKKGRAKPGARARAELPAKSADAQALEKRIELALGLRAELQQTGKGEECLLLLEIRDFDQLDTVVELLTRR